MSVLILIILIFMIIINISLIRGDMGTGDTAYVFGSKTLNDANKEC